MNIHSKKIRGLETAWLEHGTPGKPILLCFHGFPDSPMSWSEQIKYFAKDWHIIAPFSRGTGKSAPCDQLQRYSPESAVLDAAAILSTVDPKGKQPIVVMGHDLGVVLAWTWARTFEKKTKGLIMLDGLTIEQMCRRLTWPRQHLKSWYIYLMQIPGFASTVLSKLPAPMMKLASYLGDRPDNKFELDGEELSQGVMQYRAFARKLPQALKPTKRKLKVPVLCLWGTDDSFLLPPTQLELDQDAHSVTIRVLNGNHWIHQIEHKIVNNLLEEFINVNAIHGKGVKTRKPTRNRKSISEHGEAAI